MSERIDPKPNRALGRVRHGQQHRAARWLPLVVSLSRVALPCHLVDRKISEGRILGTEVGTYSELPEHRGLRGGAHPEVTCLVGKNESGKTAFLHALHLLNPLNPINGKMRFDDVMDFPSRRFSAYRKIREQSPADVVTAVFELTDTEVRIIEEDLGDGVLQEPRSHCRQGIRGPPPVQVRPTPPSGRWPT